MKRAKAVKIIVAMCCIWMGLLIPSCAASVPAMDLRQHPFNGKTPVVISVALYVTNFAAIDETRETFEVGGYLIAKWHDPRLVGADGSSTSDPARPRTFRLDELWTPAIESANNISHKTNQYFLSADRSGDVTYVESFDGVLSNNFELQRFPFDTQILRFEFQPFLSAASDFRFAPQALPSAGISPQQHTELAAWQIKGLRYKVQNAGADGSLPVTQEGVFEITVKRRSGFYVWKIFLPLIIMTIIPMVVFWIDAAQFDWLLKIPMTMLLSMVAFEFAIARDLPRIGYLTFLDAVFLASFAFFFFAIVEITAVYLLQQGGRRPLAVRLHAAGKWAYPLAYFGLIFVLSIAFLV